MKLNYEKRCQLRKDFEILLEKVYCGQKIHIDKELLEQLLFETEILNKEKNIIGKIPVWSGPFLRKIDLSGIPFKDVCWAPEFYLYPDLLEKKYLCHNFEIDYSYTNANINFMDSYHSIRRNYHQIYIQSCNFEGVDLSNNSFNGADVEFFKCNFANTNLDLKSARFVSFGENNLSNIDLSWLDVDLVEFSSYESSGVELVNSNYYNTGLKINGNIMFLDKEAKNIYYKAVKEGRIVGCFINGVLITSPIEKEISKLVRKLNYY